MTELKIKDKEIVTPGELLAEGMGFLPSFGTYREDDKIRSSRLGVVSVDKKVIKIIPLTGRYIPKKNDVVIGQMSEILMSGWRMDINCAYSAVLSVKEATSDFISKGADLTQYFGLGELVVAKIINVTTQKLIDVTMKGPGLKKLIGGRIVNVNTNKVPRIIGKQGSMVSLIKNATDCRIVVGQNGLAWIQGDPKSELIASKAINMINEQAHIPGLTDRVKTFLEKETGKKIEMKEAGDNNGL